MAAAEFFKNNRFLIYLFFLFTILLALHHVYFKNYISDEDFSYTITIYAGLISFILLILFFLISRAFIDKLTSGKITTSYINAISLEEYEKITKETTEQEKAKLFQSDEFESMLKEKGENEANWNWQLRNRMQGKLNVISDDELSNITVSEDEEENLEKEKFE
jgi:Cu/Ag efflux pump CusA